MGQAPSPAGLKEGTDSTVEAGQGFITFKMIAGLSEVVPRSCLGGAAGRPHANKSSAAALEDLRTPEQCLLRDVEVASASASGPPSVLPLARLLHCDPVSVQNCACCSRLPPMAAAQLESDSGKSAAGQGTLLGARL